MKDILLRISESVLASISLFSFIWLMTMDGSIINLWHLALGCFLLLVPMGCIVVIEEIIHMRRPF